MERVDPVDAMRLRVHLLEHDAQRLHRTGVGGCLVGHDMRTMVDAPGK